MKPLHLLLFLLLLISGCSQKTKVIVLQPLGDFPKKEAQLALQKITEINPNAILRATIPFPQKAWYKPRSRYRADILIDLLDNHIGSDTVIVGLSRKDISTTKNGVKDWGVMGLGYQPGNACVISTFRLSKKNQQAQFYKVVLHEIGHTQGLPHCPNKSCLMRDAKGGNPLDGEKGFCGKCRKYLLGKGWKLK